MVCFLCRLYVVRAHRAVSEQADCSIVVPCVTLWFYLLHSGAACYTMFRLHITCISLQRVVSTVVPFVTLWPCNVCPVVPFVTMGLVTNLSLLAEVSCVFTCNNVWCRLLHT